MYTFIFSEPLLKQLQKCDTPFDYFLLCTCSNFTFMLFGMANLIVYLYRSRKLDTQLENAIQQAMSELDKTAAEVGAEKTAKPILVAPSSPTKKLSGRLRSSQR